MEKDIENPLTERRLVGFSRIIRGNLRISLHWEEIEKLKRKKVGEQQWVVVDLPLNSLDRILSGERDVVGVYEKEEIRL